MINNLGYGFELAVCEVLFGIQHSNSADIKLLNFLMLAGKWYTNYYKCKEKPIDLIMYLSSINDKIKLMMNFKTTKGSIIG